MTRNTCSHLENITELSISEIVKDGYVCTQCKCSGPNLWVCLHQGCQEIGCSEASNDHSTLHFKAKSNHCVHMNLSTHRIWCYLCENEVFLSQRNSLGYHSGFSVDSDVQSPDSTESDDHAENDSPRGLVGLQNLGNTCYMNAALQALSNTPALTGFFLDCHSNPDLNKPGLAKSYQKLIKKMWHRKSRGYVVPSGILYGIRNVHPMFRGYHQHDTQEFLRCFMDQLHEELKQAIPTAREFSSIMYEHPEKIEEHDFVSDRSSPCPSLSPSQSEGEYETCDSGVSERSSLSEESGQTGQNLSRTSRSRSPSPTPVALVQQDRERLRSKLTVVNRNPQTNSGTDSQKTQFKSIISEVFDGKLLSSVQCLTCDRISTRVETFQDLSLPIPGRDHLNVLHQNQNTANSNLESEQQNNQDGWILWFWGWFRSWFWGPAVSLHDCLAAFFSADELKGDNMYSCEKCNKLRNGVKYSKVMALPEMLCIHLKRFRHELMYSSKISSPVNFPLTGLDMKPYLHKECVSEISTYDLSAVICHHGTAGGGHYTSMAKHSSSGLWFEYDDQFVTQVPAESVARCEAYVLFYRKSVSCKLSSIRKKAIDLVDVERATDLCFYVSKQWINRFNNCAEPGPIDNWSLLCSHGGVSPEKMSYVHRLAVPLSQPLWDYLYSNFGGGPVCNQLFECETCRGILDALVKRQNYELDTFMSLHHEFQVTESPSTIYALSMVWFRKWQTFVRAAGFAEPPGPIDNQVICSGNNSIRTGSDYAQLNHALWKFLFDIYGGGPEIILRTYTESPVTSTSTLQLDDDSVIENSFDSVHSTSRNQIKDRTQVVSSTTNDQVNIHKTQSLQNIPRAPTESLADFMGNYSASTSSQIHDKSAQNSSSVSDFFNNYKSSEYAGEQLLNGDANLNIPFSTAQTGSTKSSDQNSQTGDECLCNKKQNKNRAKKHISNESGDPMTNH